MTSSLFCRYDLRTTDPEAARSFYSEVVGLDFTETPSSEEPSMVAVWLLHEQARARGAPAHWLGHIGVTDVDATVHRLVDLGSERLGPTGRANDGATYATLRDPSGAVVSVRASTRRPGWSRFWPDCDSSKCGSSGGSEGPLNSRHAWRDCAGEQSAYAVDESSNLSAPSRRSATRVA